MAAGIILFWVMAGLTIAAASTVMVLPMLRARPATAADQGEDIAFFRSQLDELKRDLDRGLIEPEQYELAEAEIGRRVLAFERGEAAAPAKPPGPRGKWLAGLVAAALPLGAVCLYLLVGTPGFPSQPFDNRTDPAGREYRGLLDLAGTLEARLAETPADLDALIALAEARSRMAQYGPAQEAYRRAIALSSGDAAITSNLLGAFAESAILAADGSVDEQARAAIEESLRLNPQEPRSRYYQGLALLDAGDSAGALSVWRALEADSAADAPWLTNLRARIAELDNRGVASAPPIGDDAMAAMMALSEDERAGQIAGMVEGLRARLEAEPDDLEGWLRLANAYGVMGRQGEALEALNQAAGQAGMVAEALDSVLRGYFSIVPDAMTPDAQGETDMPKQAVTIAGQLYAIDQSHRAALWVLAAASRADGEPAAARGFLKLLLNQLPEGMPERREVERQLRELDG